MNRLVTRLLLALVAVSLVSMVIVPIAQALAARQTFRALAPEFRQRLEERTQPPPLLGRRTPGVAPQRRAERLEEAARLFDFLAAYRAAQRRGIVLGLALASLLGLALALWLSRSIARPIEAVAEAARRLAGGDLGARVPTATLVNQPLETRDLAGDFNRMADALETLEGERKAMLADIAHELRNPLATLQFRLEALKDGLTPFGQDEVSLLQDQVGLLSRLVSDVRVLSLADAGELSLRKAQVELRGLTRSVVESYRPRADRQGIRLEASLPEADLWLNADPDRLIQMLYNLLENALEATPEGGWIALEVKASGAELVLSVRDSGPGIPESDLETIFQRFVRGKRRDQGEQGSGLGLAIVHTLATLHGGSVQASNHGAGAELTVRLPRDLNHLNKS